MALTDTQLNTLVGSWPWRTMAQLLLDLQSKLNNEKTRHKLNTLIHRTGMQQKIGLDYVNRKGQ